MSKDKRELSKANSITVPPEKLTHPAIILLLAQNPAHGYKIIQRLSQLEYIDGEPETATIYRILRRMEQDGIIVSKWEHGEY